jgi:hypothetical protein
MNVKVGDKLRVKNVNQLLNSPDLTEDQKRELLNTSTILSNDKTPFGMNKGMIEDGGKIFEVKEVSGLLIILKDRGYSWAEWMFTNERI